MALQSRISQNPLQTGLCSHQIPQYHHQASQVIECGALFYLSGAIKKSNVAMLTLTPELILFYIKHQK